MDLNELAGSSRHPWELSRADCLCTVLSGVHKRGGNVLDIGCGDGYFAWRLMSFRSKGGLVWEEAPEHWKTKLLRAMLNGDFRICRSFRRTRLTFGLSLLMEVRG